VNEDNLTVSLLLIEDNQAFAEILIEFLMENNYVVTHCSSAEKAIARMKEEAFDLILSDIKLSGKLTGWDIVDAAPKDPCTTLLLLMTAYSEMESAEKALTRGIYDFLSKPFNLFELKIRLANAARYQKLLRLTAAAPNADEEEAPSPSLREESYKRRLEEKFAESTYQQISWGEK